ncbi:FAD-dependent oxidoreductase, partial [Mycobacterium marinum]|uniref:FAD-dependent oxidoreductase n=1 Tax=Mycobacterium marinum TaxID=1781 RepID=UPI0021C3373D
WAPPLDGLQDTCYQTSTTAVELDRLPESMIVLGGGYVALEQAQLFARLGTEVTVVARSQLVSGEEPEISAAIQAVFADEGITVHTGSHVTAVRRAGDGIVAVRAADGGERELAAEQLLVATGRRPVTGGLNLAAVGVKTGRREEIMVDEYL